MTCRGAHLKHSSPQWCLDQRFAMTAGPIATLVLLDGYHMQLLVQLLKDVFADALDLAIASALGDSRLVASYRAGKLRRLRHTRAAGKTQLA
ncbi:hypothetical protein C4Q28_17120 [Pseudomonas sp. SWI6]|uniref:Uncharacterized protein n=1 Tax=Pseudomonas putida TaxID=303 RepID=A0A2S3XCU5_PSEPU|nr:hypothetical protein C4Q28_17120 [Pseudomonas sp. SWI6]AVD95058.1 hypothetical protein C4Q27_22995 [Pseudomonas sp. SWI36]POG13307.1 hypothetical protein BGP82_02295 [Pseudomonas putida]